MKTYWKDWILNIVTTLIVYILSIKYDLFERTIDFLMKYEHLQIDELLLAILVFNIGILLINFRRRERKKIKKLLKDPITSLYNREMFNLFIEKKYNRTKLENKYISLFYIDINKFKKVNDDFGHDFGDETLRIIANKLKANLKKDDDVAFRIGGDEFAVILNAYNSTHKIKDYQIFKKHNENIAKRLSRVLKRDYEVKGKKIDFISASIGIITNSKMNKIISKDDFIKKADKAMYHSKKNGLDYIFYEDIKRVRKSKEKDDK